MDFSNTKDFKDKKILVVGFSTTGIASCKYFVSKGANVYLTESNDFLEKNKAKKDELDALGVKMEFSKHSNEFIKDSYFAIVSPSIPVDAPIIDILKSNNVPYFSDLEFLYKTDKTDKNKIILITGTNGKTTTTALVSHILSKKYFAPYCGNIGISPMEYIDKGVDYFSVEASSFQLHYSDELAPYIGIFCNLTPDHILWHKTIDNYFEAKAKPFRNMSANQNAILNYDDEFTKKLGKNLKAKVYYFSLQKQNIENCIYLENDNIIFENKSIININELNIVGPHNVQNAMCAILASKIIGLDDDTIKDALKSFKAIEHRLEFIRNIQGTSYYNDSKATNPEASIVAINSFVGKRTVLIAGGRDKMTSLDDFVQSVKNNISKVILIGEAKERFKDELSKSDYINIVNARTLEEAIDIASLDKPDVVLLSPACASFDMFESYEKRGDAFKKYVLSKK